MSQTPPPPNNPFSDPANHPAADNPQQQPYAPPQTYQQPGADATGGLIPYKNPPALIGYYMSVASLIPLLGNILGLVAIIFGIVGLKRRAANPVIKGTAHCWVAIILGSITFLGYNGCVIFSVIAAATG
jgi:hypothetical protein